MQTPFKFVTLSTIAVLWLSQAEVIAEPSGGSARMQLQFCKLAADEISMSVSECLRQLRSIRGIVNACKTLQEKDQLWLIEAMFDEEAANRGQCMRILRKNL